MSYSAGDYFGELVPCLQTVKFPNFSGTYMRVSINGGTPKSSTLIGFSLINHPAIGVPPFMETPIWLLKMIFSGTSKSTSA